MITINLESSIPIEEQIRSGIRQSIARGDIRPGDELPSARQLAGDLDVHWNTVARAYRKLRDEGILLVGQGRSVRVLEGVLEETAKTNGKVQEKIETKLREVLTEARLGGVSVKKVTAMIFEELKHWEKKEERS